LGTFCINSASAIAHSRDRLFAHQLLSRAGVSMPTTAFAHYPGDTKDMIKILGGAPLVIKLLEGQQGNKGVVLAQTNKSAAAVIQAFRGLKANFIAQQYIQEPKSKDILCVILGNKVITAIQQETSSLELLTDEITIPRKSQVIEITLVEKKLAIRAVRVLGLKFAVVNFLRTKAGPRVIDVNSSPSFKPIEKISGLDLGALIIDYLEHHARPRLPKRVIGYSI
ncbi:MAG TPA: 30S ribosomal protein S6--L-glutamate ligase, partial [Candidatus Berkiella sp.]|nr:30S ribosomal protein S6--L-glutamate ligase [Candidatus Berkiella sp.]